MPEDLESLASSLLAELCAKHPIGYTPTLIWKRLRVTAGVAYYKVGAIGLSQLLLSDPERLAITLKHEYAHLMAYARYGRKGSGHGPAWKAAMREVGLEPKVRHKYEVSRNVPRQEVGYICQRCGAIIQRKRRLPSRGRYAHAQCGGALKLRYVRPATVEESKA